MPVITIASDYSAKSDGGTKTDHSLACGSFFGTHTRGAARFSLATAPAGAPTKVELIVSASHPVGTFGGSHLIRAYNSTGQTDPSPDVAATFYNRCAGTSYLTTNALATDGLKTIDISGAQIFSDIAAAKTAVGRFSIGFTQFNEPGASDAVTLAPDTDGTNPPKLRLTYPETTKLSLFWDLF